jgi:hypothetical protein
MSRGSSSPGRLRPRRASSSALGPRGTARLAAWLAIAAVLPAIVVAYRLYLVAAGDMAIPDLQAFLAAAERLVRLESPYPEYVYPPLTALVATPLAFLSASVANLVTAVVLTLAVVATLLVLGVRDWRCYGVVFLWPATHSAVQTGNITILLGLGAALAWRYRDRAPAAAISVGTTLAAKLFLWALVVWLAASGRWRAAWQSVVAGALVLLGSWAILGFSGLLDYPDIVRRVQDTVELDAYTVYALARDLGLPAGVARTLWLVVGFGALAGCVALGRRGDERGSFVLAIAAALALSPIVWLHYFELLLVAVAVARPRLGAAWLVPIAMVVSTGTGNGTSAQTAATLALAALTVALAVRSAGRGEEPAGAAAGQPAAATAAPAAGSP